MNTIDLQVKAEVVLLSEKGRRVVVTGLGMVSCLGTDTDIFFNKLCSGVDATSPITSFQTNGLKKKFAVQIKDDIPIMDKWKHYYRTMQFCLVAAHNALQDAHIPVDTNKNEMAVSMGTMFGQIPDIQNELCKSGTRDYRQLYDNHIREFEYSSIADSLAYEFRITGLRNTVAIDCASSTAAIGMAYRWIKSGRTEIVLCGGIDTFSILSHHIMSSMRLISADKARPFDACRKGFLFGEGSGMLILESEENALKRGVKMHCEVLGYGCSCDAGDLNLPDENGKGLSKAMEEAISESCLQKKDIGYINAYGVGAKATDMSEIKSIRNTFSKELSTLYVSSTKGSIGHTSGASGAIDAITSILVLKNRKIPPTVNYEENNDIADVQVVCKKPAKFDGFAAISNSITFGGINTSILLGKYAK